MPSNTENTAELIDASELASPTRVSARVARVVEVLAERIHSGIYAVGTLLPTERALASDLQAHRRTIRAAIDHLVQEGLVSRRPHYRPTVARPPGETEENEAQQERAQSAARISTSNLVALLMWHGGGPLEHAGTSQQRVFWGMNQVLTQLGYHAVFLDLGERIASEDENAVREARHLRYVRDQGFGGALFYPYAYRRNRDLVEEVSRTVPLVLLDRRVSGTDTDFVGIENHGAMLKMTRHLIGQGHRRIAHVTSSQPIPPVQDRIQGYIDAMRSVDAAIAPDMREIILHVPDNNYAQSWTAVDAVFGLPEGQRPTAAVCFTDYMAVSLATRLEQLGLSIPGDVALTGFDNIVPTLPDRTGLTTAAQPYEEIGITAVNVLMRRIKNRQSPTTSVELPVTLVLRASSASANIKSP